MTSIGDKIRARRLELHMTQEELAEKLGYKSKSTINKIELGVNDIVQSKVVEFARALDTTTSYLMSWDEPSHTPTLTASETTLLSNYRQLNEEGQEKVREYTSDLVASGRYIKADSDGVDKVETA